MLKPEKILKLMLTAIGKKTMTMLLAKGKKPYLKVGVSKYTEKITGEEFDSVDKFILLDSAISPVVGETINSLQIQATFPADDFEVDLYKIGLFIIDKESNSKEILLGLYQSMSLLAKKLKNTDIFLNVTVSLLGYSADHFTINASDYRPLFQLPVATFENYGAVRLATSEDSKDKLKGLVLSTDLLADRERIEKKEPGFILTTNDLASLTCKKEDRLEANLLMAKYAIDLKGNRVNAIPSFALCWDGEFVNNLVKVKTVLKETLFLIRYKLKTNEIEDIYNIEEDIKETKSFIHILNWKNNNPYCDYKSDEGIQYYYFVEETLHKLSFFFKDGKIGGSYCQEIGKLPIGKVFSYNEVMASLTNVVEKKLGTLNLNYLKKFVYASLRYYRVEPLVEVIQDKIYIIGGGRFGANIPPVEIYTAYLKANNINDPEPFYCSSFIPPSPLTIDLPNTSKLLACHIKNCIYLFVFSNSKDDLKRLEPLYYCYDTLSNEWLSLEFEKKDAVLFEINQVRLITIGEIIYLFSATVEQEGESRLTYSVLSFTRF